MQGDSPTDSGVLYWITTALDVDPVTSVCIIIRCRTTGISTLNVRVCELEC